MKSLYISKLCCTIVHYGAGLHIKLHTRILYCTYVYTVLRLNLVLRFRILGGITVCLVVHVYCGTCVSCIYISILCCT